MNPYEDAGSDEVCDVVAWSSSHLSEDDSDEEEPSSSSQSPSRNEFDDCNQEVTESDDVNELPDNWIFDVDLPDGTEPLPTATVTFTAKKEPVLHQLPPTQADAESSDTRDSKLDDLLAIRPAEPVAVQHEFDVSSPPKPISQIPRLTPPLARQFSLNSSFPAESSSPPRLLRSPSQTQSLVTAANELQYSPTGRIRRGQSIYSVPDRITEQEGISTQRPMISTSSQFWANEHNRRSSRLLDEWKRKEIWHDFKRAEEDVLTNPSPPMSGQAVDQAASLLSAKGSLYPKTGSASSLDDALDEVRSNTLSQRGDQRQPIHRASSFAIKSSVPLDKSDGARADSSLTEMGVWHEGSSNIVKSAPAMSVTQVEYERLVDDKHRLADEVEARTRSLLAEQETTRILQERLLNLENSDRENRFLKEEIQKHLMHELSSKELVKTLEDQLSLTARSETQLKMQTRQLMQQNQALQADLLEKMSAETSKIQKMAQLSAEKQKLHDEFQRSETQSSQKAVHLQGHLRMLVLRHLFSGKRLGELRAAFSWWRTKSRERAASQSKAAVTLVAVTERLQVKTLALAFRRLDDHARRAAHHELISRAEGEIAVTEARQRSTAQRASAVLLLSFLRKKVRSAIQDGWSHWQFVVKSHKELERRLTVAHTKLRSVIHSRHRTSTQKAFTTWLLQASFNDQRFNCEKAKEVETELLEAKDCIFSLSRAKTRLEEKLQSIRQEAQRTIDQLRGHQTELQLVKHGYVAVMIRSTERHWLRSIFGAWREQTQVELCEKESRLQLEMAELKIEERDKYARSLDDYNKVLRNDLERFQFFSQDKRIVVDVLTKKLLREEEKIKQMEEQQVTLEEKVIKYKAQLASILEGQSGVTLPIALVQLCRDITLQNLRQVFARLADNNSAASPAEQSVAASDDRALSYRLSITDFVQFLRESSALDRSTGASSDLSQMVQRHVPDYAMTQGLKFGDFVASLGAIAKETFDSSPASKGGTKLFWSSLLSYALGSIQTIAQPISHRDAGDATLHSTHSPWAGQLSEDILQNQEKLLAVLEHETAVVERAVMEKSSLKHTYASSEHSTSALKQYHEYQCEPVIPPESQPTQPESCGDAPLDSQFVMPGLGQFANWSNSSQVQDLFHVFQAPLQRIVNKYSSETIVAAHGNQVCLLLSGVARMLEDMRLYPTYLSHDLVHHHFGRLCSRDRMLTPQALAIFLGCCALELFARSLPNINSTYRLSAREIVLSFFCDLGLLVDSDIPGPPRICLVGLDVETIVWPLFEYYALSDGSAGRQNEDARIGMTINNFVRFAADIVSTSGPAAERLFYRVISETRWAVPASPATETEAVLHLDEFYVILAYLQAERCPNVRYANLGEAVRHWMQQSQ